MTSPHKHPHNNHNGHPCFGSDARTSYGRIHLPVAPASNARTRYEDPLYLASENSTVEKPPVVMKPADSIRYLEEALAEDISISVIGITGPGEPFANPAPTLETLRLLKSTHPEISRCVTTNGIGVAQYADTLAELVDHVTVTVLGIDAEIVEQLYAWIRPAKRNITLSEGVTQLLEAQEAAITALKSAGVTVKVNTTLYPTINADHIEDIAKHMAELGVDIMHITPFQAPWDNGIAIAPPTKADVEKAHTTAAKHLPVMELPKGTSGECGFMIVGKMGEGATTAPEPVTATTGLPVPSGERPNIAVASGDGMEVNLHLGHARKMLIYGPSQGPVSLLEARAMPAPGSGDDRWNTMAEALSDCSYVLVASAGARPRTVLEEAGLRVLQTEGEIDPLVDKLYGGGKGKKCKR